MKIAILPGDGIGPEVIEQAIKVLKKVSPETIYKQGIIGGAAYDQLGDPLPSSTLDLVENSDAILLGAVGGPQYEHLQAEKRPEQGLLRLRKHFDLFANFRPAQVYPELETSSPLKSSIISGLNLLMIRELTGDIYFGQPRGRSASPEIRAFDTMCYTEHEIRRIARVAFNTAKKRSLRVCSIDKANVLETSRFWREIVVDEHSKQYPEIELTHQYVDNAAMQLLKNPKQFDVILVPNMFGDILSDEASMLTGSIGLLPSASLNDGTFGLYEPIHGSAPDIAGQNKANPLGTILSLAMLFRYSFGNESTAQKIENAVALTIKEGYRTHDLTQFASEAIGTQEMGDAVLKNINLHL